MGGNRRRNFQGDKTFLTQRPRRYAESPPEFRFLDSFMIPILFSLARYSRNVPILTAEVSKCSRGRQCKGVHVRSLRRIDSVKVRDWCSWAEDQMWRAKGVNRCDKLGEESASRQYHWRTPFWKSGLWKAGRRVCSTREPLQRGYGGVTGSYTPAWSLKQDRPWGELRLGRKLNESWLATQLRPYGICAEEPAHALHKVRIGGFHDQVEMIFHQAVGVHLPAGFLAGLSQRFEEILSIHIIYENVLAPVAPIHDVVNRAGILDSHRAWHGRKLARCPAGSS